MAASVSLKQIFFGDNYLIDKYGQPLLKGVDGFALYLVTVEDDGGGKEYEIFQPFKLHEACQINNRNVWSWDGNKEAPTLTPSFLYHDQDVRIHLFLKHGKIELLPDSTAKLVA
ncbi:MAG: DUF6527 family protein [Thermoprotei archaeon]